jgi:hypothetical protein
MALIVEDGTGVEGANSYADIVTIDAYHTALGATTWTGDDTAKEQAVIRAMRWLESNNFVGVKGAYTNALEWPRNDAYSRNGYLIPDNEIPTSLKESLAEAALIELVTPNSLSPTITGRNVKKKVVGPLETEYFQSASSTAIYSTIEARLMPLLRLSNQVMRS